MEDELYLEADAYKELRDVKSELESQLKKVNEELKEHEFRIIELMTDKEMDSFKRKGVQFICRKFVAQSADPETKDEFYAELKKRGFEDWFTVNTNTLKARVRELTEANDGILPEWLTGFIKEYETQQLSIRKY